MSQLAVWQLKYENDKIYYYVTEYPWPAHAVKDPTQECIDLGRKCVCVCVDQIHLWDYIVRDKKQNHT